MRYKIIRLTFLAAFLFPAALNLKADGISVDAGLTPAQDRIIVRLQYRSILNQMGGDDIVMHIMPMVVAYGLSPDITLMMRNAYRALGTNETMMKLDNRWMDPFLMGKVKLFRHNARNYTIGLAGFVGTTFPVLNNSISNSYSPVIGINASFRPGLWSFDLNNAYEWVDYDTDEKQSEAKQLQVNLAISRNILLPGIENWVLAPVQEFSFLQNNPTSGGESTKFGFISTGIQFISPHVKLEGLYQIAVNSSQISGIKYGNRLILGLRFMF